MALSVQLWQKATNRLGESVIWHSARRCYFWVDLLDPALFCHDHATKETQRFALALPPPIGSIAATTDENLLVLAHRGGLSLLDLRDLTLTAFCDPESGRDAIIYNDIKADRWGRLWVGTSHEKEQEARGVLWCVESAKRWAPADAGFAISNGPAFSLDGRTLYFNDSVGRRTFAYDIAPDHLAARNRRVLILHENKDGLPDGITVDSEDCLWTVQWASGSILRFDREGKLLERLQLPVVHTTTLGFGGDGLKQAVITTATDGASPDQLAALPLSGSLFSFESPVPGVAEPLFNLRAD